MGMFDVSENKKIGIGLFALGFIFMALGAMLFFDRVFLALGNFMFLTGFPFLIGFKKALLVFNPFYVDEDGKRVYPNPTWKAICLFLFGAFLVFYGWTKTGIVVEFWGVIGKFGGIFPSFLPILKTLPYVGVVFKTPIVKKMFEGARRYSSRPDL
eukprot:TRINITY_DN778063_c0_g1_i1.p1 TRINITY_DN778063_c0_g1~~TRINITY_DN778063_c0_g1_i1.p1  ORF type:complete len:155 (-),score=28.78 TRINITY_DN778063_c0_g1_i1:108-572(-)